MREERIIPIGSVGLSVTTDRFGNNVAVESMAEVLAIQKVMKDLGITDFRQARKAYHKAQQVAKDVALYEAFNK